MIKVPMHWIGAIILVAVISWYAFLAMDSLALPSQQGSAKILAKSYRPAGQTYVTQIVNNKPVVLPQAQGEQYILKLSLLDHETEAFVTKEFYESAVIGEMIGVDYSVLRLRRRPQIIGVRVQ